MLFGTVLSIISYVVCLLIIPESPSWLLINGRTQEAIAVFNYIGRFNGVKE